MVGDGHGRSTAGELREVGEVREGRMEVELFMNEVRNADGGGLARFFEDRSESIDARE